MPLGDFYLLDAVKTPVDQKADLNGISMALRASTAETLGRLETAMLAEHIAEDEGVYSLTEQGTLVYQQEERRLNQQDSDRIRNDRSRRWQQ